MKEPNKNHTGKIAEIWDKLINWVKKNKVKTGIIVFVLILGFSSVPSEEDESKSEDKKQEKKVDKKETDTQETVKEDTNKSDDEDTNVDTEDVESDKEEQISTPSTDEDELKDNLKAESLKVKDLEFVNGGDEIQITIEVSSAMSKKSTVRAMKAKTADALYTLKKTDLNFSTADVYVSPPDEEQYAMTSRWTYEDVNELDEDSTYTLPDEMEEKADGFMLNSYFR